MRTSTRRKYWGRSGVAQALRGAQHALEGAIAETGKETPLELALKEVSKELGQALEAWKVYQLEQKRVRGKIEREIKHISEILLEVQGMPVTAEEKTAKKAAKRKQEGVIPGFVVHEAGVPHHELAAKSRKEVTKHA